MYRQSKMQEQDKMAAQEQFFTRLGNIPVVNTAWSQACHLYQRTKESNAVFRTTLSAAESSIKTVAETAKPLVEKYQPQVDQVNSFACQQLTTLEDKCPVIKKPTEELMNDGKALIQPVIQPALDKVNAVKQYGTDTVNAGKERVENAKQYGYDTVTGVKDFGVNQVTKAMGTPYGQFVTGKVNDALTLSEEYLEKYLPEDEDEDEYEDSDDDSKKELDEWSEPNPITRARDLTTKMRKRMYKRALRDLRTVQVRSQESLAKLSFTVDLIEYAKSNIGSAKEKTMEKMEEAQNKMASIWTEVTKETDEEEEVPTTLEGKSIAVARHLTKQIRQGVVLINYYLPESLQPAALRGSLQDMYKQSEELYQNFKNVGKYEDLSAWALTQSKEKLGYLQTTLGFLTETFITVPINWLGPGKDGKREEIEMQKMD